MRRRLSIITDCRSPESRGRRDVDDTVDAGRTPDPRIIGTRHVRAAPQRCQRRAPGPKILGAEFAGANLLQILLTMSEV
jgi:hypothetical protein